MERFTVVLVWHHILRQPWTTGESQDSILFISIHCTFNYHSLLEKLTSLFWPFEHWYNLHHAFLYTIFTFDNYSTTARWIWVGYNHHISNKRERNNCCIKNAHKTSRILPDHICKNNRFSAYFLFWADAYSYHNWRAWYNGSHTMMAKPIRALELYYPMIQLLKIFIISSSPFQGFITNQLYDLLPVGFLAQLVRVLGQYRSNQGLLSYTSLNFSGFLFTTAKVASITSMIFLPLILHPAVRIYDFSTIHYFILIQSVH